MMKELRKQLRLLRKSIDEKTRKEDGKKILHQCQKNKLFEGVKHIAIFIPNDGEIETEHTIKFLKDRGYFIYLPILVGEKLKFAEMGEHFRKNRFGIDEPMHTHIMDVEQIDLIFMPLVGFDKNKNRLGMGGGFYDKTLSFKLKSKNYHGPKLFGLAFDCQEVEYLDAQPWDVPVDGIVTPTRFLN